MKDFSLWALLPLLHALFTAAGLWLVYSVAVDNQNVAPLSSQTWRTNGSLYPPYISIAGNFPPASCIFSQVMNLSAFAGLLIGLLRYLQVRRRLVSVWLNRCSLAAFSTACCGMSLLGNFQIFPQLVVHNLGTALTFGLGLVFCWTQAVITLKADQGSRAGAAVRFLLSACITLCMVPYFWLMALEQHLQAARCQWALVSFLLLFISTFALEFRHSSFHIVTLDTAARPFTQSDHRDASEAPPTRI
ncbi:transmembrane protein 150C isoform X2 [Salarias fasciatus]|nr:transmembrane protein 150C-like isoform X2 [Salarias fasciatus]XP_029940326.1 transmembrane protein 150C-like isoform X2 [Salarias fasciatus]